MATKVESKEMKEKNAQLFRRCMSDKNATPQAVLDAIGRYVGKEYPDNTAGDERNRIAARGNLNKELNRNAMTEKVLVKGLTILNYTKVEITTMLADR
jgi:hypothetical protein